VEGNLVTGGTNKTKKVNYGGEGEAKVLLKKKERLLQAWEKT